MPMTESQIKKLLEMIVDVQPDELDCDGCSQQLAEFAERHLLGKSIEQSQREVQAHLQNCHCCEMEFKSLLDALKAIPE